jgi:hypothetical protein
MAGHPDGWTPDGFDTRTAGHPDGWTPDGWPMDAGHSDGWTGDGWTGERTPNSGHGPAPDGVTDVLAFPTSATTLPHLGPPSEDSARQAPLAAIGNQDCLAVKHCHRDSGHGRNQAAPRWHSAVQAAPRRTALLGRFRVERRANGEASSVMAGLSLVPGRYSVSGVLELA